MTNGTDEDDPRDRLDELRERIRSGDLSAVKRDQLDQLVFVVVLAERRAETVVRDFPGGGGGAAGAGGGGVGAGLNSATHHGGVEHAELTEPFATLLADTSREAMGRAQDAPDAPGTVEATDPPVITPRDTSGDQGANGHCPTDVLVRTYESDHETHGDLVTVGSNVAILAPPAGLEPATRRLEVSCSIR